MLFDKSAKKTTCRDLRSCGDICCSRLGPGWRTSLSGSPVSWPPASTGCSGSPWNKFIGYYKTQNLHAFQAFTKHLLSMENFNNSLPVLPAQALDKLEQAVKVNIACPDAWRPVDRGPSVVHVLQTNNQVRKQCRKQLSRNQHLLQSQ